jgi:hypothetical protein
MLQDKRNECKPRAQENPNEMSLCGVIISEKSEEKNIDVARQIFTFYENAL